MTTLDLKIRGNTITHNNIIIVFLFNDTTNNF